MAWIIFGIFGEIIMLGVMYYVFDEITIGGAIFATLMVLFGPIYLIGSFLIAIGYSLDSFGGTFKKISNFFSKPIIKRK